MNREQLLACIHRHLRETSAEAGEVRPLGEVVLRVAGELQTTHKALAAERRLLPVGQVAAFVDGDLSESEARVVRNAALVDNGVLAELVAAVRSREEVAPALSLQLHERLLALNPSAPTPVKPLVAEPPRERIEEVPTASPTVVAVPNNKPAIVRPLPRTARKSPAKATDWYVTVGALLLVTVAAVVVVGVFLSQRSNPKPDGVDIVEHESAPKNVGPTPPIVPVPEPIVPETEDKPDALVNTDNDPPKPTVVPQRQPDTVANDNDRPPNRPPTIAPAPPRDSVVKAPRMAAPVWSKINGLLTQHHPGQQDAVAATQRTWKPVAEQTATAVNGYGEQQTALRTLPFSRAEAKLASGGKLVLGSDTGVQIAQPDSSSSAEVNLQHGSLAMVDLPQGTVVKLIGENESFTHLSWHSRASAIVQHTTDGLQLQIDGGTIAINDDAHTDKSFILAKSRPARVIDKPSGKRDWVDGPVDAIGIPRAILLQLAAADDLGRALSQQINAMSQKSPLSKKDARTLAALAKWRVAMIGPQLYRLVGSRQEALRLAALQRLVEMPTWDPRYKETWKAAAQQIPDQQRLTRLRRWCDLVQRGGKPPAAQVDQLLSGLSGQQLSTRAISDYLLRRFYNGGPVFDPTWTGQNQTRGVSLWQQYVGRPNTRLRATVQP